MTDSDVVEGLLSLLLQTLFSKLSVGSCRGSAAAAAPLTQSFFCSSWSIGC